MEALGFLAVVIVCWLLLYSKSSGQDAPVPAEPAPAPPPYAPPGIVTPDAFEQPLPSATASLADQAQNLASRMKNADGSQMDASQALALAYNALTLNSARPNGSS
jgi:hypothetical protein